MNSRGWTVQGAEPSGGAARIVLVLEDDDGLPWAGWRPTIPEHTIGIGSLSSAARLTSLAAAGATILDVGLPFLTLIQQVEAALVTPEAFTQQQRLRRAARVRRRAREYQAVAELTQREREVLCGLVHGLSAQAIADQGVRSLATVRSQIQSMSRRLGVTTQLAAVAMVHRSGRTGGMGQCLDGLHQL